MLAFTVLLTVLTFFTTTTVVAAGHIETILFSRQISPSWIPEKCNDQCPVALEIANGQCPTYECMCTDRINNALVLCLGCTIQSEKDTDPNFAHQMETAYDLYWGACDGQGLKIPKLSVTSSPTGGSPSGGSSGGPNSTASGGGNSTSGGTGSGSGGSGGSGSGGSSGNDASSSHMVGFGLGAAIVATSLFLL